MDRLRLATASEIESIKDHADLDFARMVIAFPNGDKPADLAVVKQLWELDPVFFAPETGDKRKALFVWTLENAMKLNGISAYYFNVPADATQYHAVLKNMGAEPTSPGPEIRFKKVL